MATDMGCWFAVPGFTNRSVVRTPRHPNRDLAPPVTVFKCLKMIGSQRAAASQWQIFGRAAEG